MRNVILLMHVSLDGFVAGPKGEMDWIRFDDDMIDYTHAITQSADTALFGRATYQMMAGYWPTAAEQPGAAKHDIDHARWVNPAPKLVFSKTLKAAEWENSRIISDNIAEEITRLKQQPGKNLLMIGSTKTAQTFMRLGLLDEYRININPVVLGGGVPLFKNIEDRINLELVETKTFSLGVTHLHLRTVR